MNKHLEINMNQIKNLHKIYAQARKSNIHVHRKSLKYKIK